MDEIQRAILKTLAFFDLFSYPLTREEVFSYLWKIKIDRETTYKVLTDLSSNKIIEQKNGYYFLNERETTYEARRVKLLAGELKMKIARRAVAKISAVPFVKAVFVCNSVAFGLAETNSDIDLFIVTAKKRIWLTRFFTNLILLIFRLRRINQKNVSNRVCLSFYIVEENLNLQNIRALPEDIYLAYWLATLLPIYDADEIKNKIILANGWMKDFLPNFSSNLSSYVKEIKNGPFKKFFKILLQKTWSGGYGDLMEKQAKEAQVAKMKFSLQDFKDKAPGVVVNDFMLKFHEEDRRKEYYEKWKLKCYEQIH